MEDLDFLVGIAFFLVVYGIFHLYVRRKERLALIDKGLTASIFNSEANVAPSLKYGIFCIGIAIGFLLGELLCEYTHINEGVAYLSMLFLKSSFNSCFLYFILN